MGEGLAGQVEPDVRVRARGSWCSPGHQGVVGGVHDDAHVGPVFGRGPQQGHPPYVDHFDRRLRPERVEVAHDQADRVDAVPGQVVTVPRVSQVGQDPGMKAGVKGLDPAAQHLRPIGHGLDGCMR